MVQWQTVTWRAAVAGRRTALLFGSLTILFFMAFAIGEGLPQLSHMTGAETFEFAAIAALFIGLMMAQKWEGAGGLLILISFASLIGMSFSHLKLVAFDVAAVVGAIHIICWWRLRSGPPAALAPLHVSRIAVIGLASALTIFLLLCANEIFGRPPLMTPVLHPASDLAGAWIQTGALAVALNIHADTSVTGTVGGNEISEARVTYGRSWFGRLLHWNAAYVIRGRLGNRIFSAPFTAGVRTLNGSLFRDGRPVGLNLSRP